MALGEDQLRDAVRTLLRRPRHEKVRAVVYELLVLGLGADEADLSFEEPLPEVRGRVDALLGRTVMEFKSDLRRELGDAEEELSRYLADRERQTGSRYVGIATDGAQFRTYELREGRLSLLGTYKPSKETPHELLMWLDSALALLPQLSPEPRLVRDGLGKDSLAFEVARARLSEAWQEVGVRPAVVVKRELWASLLEKVYGSRDVGADDLFFQHTYLTVVAKTMALRVLGVAMPTPARLLSGRPFENAGINGAVESDFFDWILEASEGENFIKAVAAQVSRFELMNVRQDVLKGLYESLIDPEQRHDLGEYYTPDWLAERICEDVIKSPLKERVLDPACGSGTFLFHAVRKIVSRASRKKVQPNEIIQACVHQVLGVDVHPVAVIIARVTYLLALGDLVRSSEREGFSIPVYLGDSLQWNTRQILASREVEIRVPDGPNLLFPFEVTEDPGTFDRVLARMQRMSEESAPPDGFKAWLKRNHITEESQATLVTTYSYLRELTGEGKDHIWGYVARNLARPIWLSSPTQRVDAIVGNPPWLAYRQMSPSMQEKFAEEAQRLGVWTGKAAARDLSGYFFARCVELYLRSGGRIGFVLPYAALSRSQFQGFRSGDYGSRQSGLPGRGRVGSALRFAQVRFTAAWAFDNTVKPLFQVPSCALFATEGEPGPLPETVMAFHGVLPRRDATATEANVLASEVVEWPRLQEGAPSTASEYRPLFRQGAPLVPRMLILVEYQPGGRLGVDPTAPVVTSRRSPQEDRVWRELDSLEGAIEREFLRPTYVSRCILPFRVLAPEIGVIPFDASTGDLLGGNEAVRRGFAGLATWLEQAERLWEKYGQEGVHLIEALDFFGSLTSQLSSTHPIRIVYPEAGAQPAAAIVRDSSAIIDHDLYWYSVPEEEAYYLIAVLNSEELRSQIEEGQSLGLYGRRHFSKVVFDVPIPRFDGVAPLHGKLVAAGRKAEAEASRVVVADSYFVNARKSVRRALSESGIMSEIDGLVAELIPRPAAAMKS